MAFFPFYVTKRINEMPERVAVLFHHHNGDDSDALNEALEDLTNRRLPPTRILTVCGFGDESRIRDQFQALDATTKGRLSIITHFKILPYDSRGQLRSGDVIDLVGIDWSINDDELSKLAFEGLEQLIKDCGVILTAPRGYQFRKPSGHTNRIFVRTGNLFRVPSSLGLISFLLMKHIPIDTRRLYIDSFTILSAALSFNRARNRIVKAENSKLEEPEIVNLHSYSIDPRMRFPSDTDYYVLISASTSGGLVQKFVKEHGGDVHRMVHLLGLSPNEGLKSTSIYFQKLQNEKKPVAGSIPKEICIPGEEFIASSSSTQAVSITKDHFCTTEGEILKARFYQKALSVSFAALGAGAYSLIELANDTEEANPEFDKWLNGEINHAIPVNTRWILSADEDASRRLANRIQNLLQDHLGQEPPIYNLDEITSDFDLSQELQGHSVLVVCSATGTGEELLAASRALRNLGAKHRHYLVAHVFPETAFQLRRLERNLCVSGEGRDYGWSNFIGMPIGVIDRHDSWSVERALYGPRIDGEAWDALDSIFQATLGKRVELLDQRGSGSSDLFYPTVAKESLQLRKDSVLLTSPYEHISQATIYAIVSAGLQRARDGKRADGKDLRENLCFDGNPFVATVLDPGMFARFNDGIIQAAILRACAPDELNYASDEALSRHMRDILISAVNHCDSPTGEAVLEMLLALAVKRLRLKDHHFEEVVVAIHKTDSLKSFWNLLKSEPDI